jgi:hypothetical protein
MAVIIMVKFIVIFFSFFCINSFANAFDLHGEWIVDREKTIDFNTRNIKFSSVRLTLLNCSAENSNLFFLKNNGNFIMKDHFCEHDGKKALIKGTIDNFTYSVIFKNDKQTVLKLKGEDKELHVEVINWIDSDGFWINQGDDEEVFRYFYRRR